MLLIIGPKHNHPQMSCRIQFMLLLLTCIEGERSLSDNNTATVAVPAIVTIAGGFLGALVAILLMLLTAVGIVIFIKKGIWDCLQQSPVV